MNDYDGRNIALRLISTLHNPRLLVQDCPEDKLSRRTES